MQLLPWCCYLNLTLSKKVNKAKPEMFLYMLNYTFNLLLMSFSANVNVPLLSRLPSKLTFPWLPAVSLCNKLFSQ